MIGECSTSWTMVAAATAIGVIAYVADSAQQAMQTAGAEPSIAEESSFEEGREDDPRSFEQDREDGLDENAVILCGDRRWPYEADGQRQGVRRVGHPIYCQPEIKLPGLVCRIDTYDMTPWGDPQLARAQAIERHLLPLLICEEDPFFEPELHIGMELADRPRDGRRHVRPVSRWDFR